MGITGFKEFLSENLMSYQLKQFLFHRMLFTNVLSNHLKTNLFWMIL